MTKRNQYGYEKLFDAYFAVTEEGLSQAEASREYGVPSRTIGDRLIGRTPLECMSIGRRSLLNPEQEEGLRCHIIKMASLGYGYTRSEVREIATEYACDLGLRMPGSTWLSNCWIQRFKARNNLQLSQPRGLDIYRARASSEENVNSYFINLKATLIRHNLMHYPECIFNVDEKGLTPHYKPPKIMSRRGKSTAVIPAKGGTTTVIAGGNAIGNSIPPFFIFQGERYHSRFVEDGTPGTNGTVSPTGWSNKEIFKVYLEEHFLRFAHRADPSRPLLVIYDGHKSHITLSIVEWARRLNIILFVLPAHTSHFLQPLDVACFRSFESSFTQSKHRIMRTRDASALRNEDMCRYGCLAYSEALKPKNLIAGFKKTGIMPFVGMQAVDPAILTPSEPFVAPIVAADDFFGQREKVLEAKSRRAKRRRVVGDIVGGREITSDNVEGQLRRHVEAQERRGKFNVRTSCCQCWDEQPPVCDDENTDAVDWVMCDTCDHWVHLGLCVPYMEVGGATDYYCPCCVNGRGEVSDRQHQNEAN